MHTPGQENPTMTIDMGAKREVAETNARSTSSRETPGLLSRRPIMEDVVDSLFDGLRRAALDYGAATYLTAKRMGEIKRDPDPYLAAFYAEQRARRRLINLLTEARLSVRRHMEER